MFFRKGFSIIDSLNIFYIQGIIFHGKVIHYLVKSNMGSQFDSVGINVIVDHISVGMCITSKEYFFGYMVLQLRFFSFRGVANRHDIQMSEGRRFYLALCVFLNSRSNCIRFLKGIGKLDSMVQVIWPTFDIQVVSS